MYAYSKINASLNLQNIIIRWSYKLEILMNMLSVLRGGQESAGHAQGIIKFSLSASLRPSGSNSHKVKDPPHLNVLWYYYRG